MPDTLRTFYEASLPFHSICLLRQDRLLDLLANRVERLPEVLEVRHLPTNPSQQVSNNTRRSERQDLETHLVEDLRAGARPPPAGVEVMGAVRLVLQQELALERSLDLAELRGRVDLTARLLDGQRELHIRLYYFEANRSAFSKLYNGNSGRTATGRTMWTVSSPLSSRTRVPMTSARRFPPSRASWWQ